MTPRNIAIPIAIIIRFPMAKVAVCSVWGNRVWAKPLTPARKVCQVRDARKAPAMKRNELKVLLEPVAFSPRIKVVK